MKTIICFVLIVVALAESRTYNKPIWKWQDIILDDDFNLVSSVQYPKIILQRDIKPRMLNGTNISENDKHKFQVRLFANKNEKTFGCGGSIIAPRIIMTAAHCVQDATKIEVYAGVRDVKDIETGTGNIQKQEVYPDSFKVPNTWKKIPLIDDIALIILKEDIIFSDTVGKVALPSSQDKCSDYVGKKLNIFGWGKINDKGDRASILQTAVVDAVDSTQCKDLYDWLFNDKMICADASKFIGTCQGDSGGPVTIKNKDESIIIGLVSYGPHSCVSSEPRVFTCIASHLNWIQETMNEAKLVN